MGKRLSRGITVAGTMLVDKIYDIEFYPPLGGLAKIKGIKRAVGGAVPNVGIDMKLLAPHLSIKGAGRLGEDDDGMFILKTLNSYGVETEAISFGKGNTGFTDVMSIVGGQRTFFTSAGECAEFCASDIDFDRLDTDMLHLAYLMLLDRVDAGEGEKILREARERGIKTSVDLVSAEAERYLTALPLLPYVDNLIVNETEAGGIAGIEPLPENIRKIAEKLKAAGVRERVIIHMPDMGVCLSDEGYTTLPSFDLPKGFIKGTTGAGDAFCAGALVGIHEGLSNKEILELASSSAVASLSEADAVSGMRALPEIRELCKNLKRK